MKDHSNSMDQAICYLYCCKILGYCTVKASTKLYKTTFPSDRIGAFLQAKVKNAVFVNLDSRYTEYLK